MAMMLWNRMETDEREYTGHQSMAPFANVFGRGG